MSRTGRDCSHPAADAAVANALPNLRQHFPPQKTGLRIKETKEVYEGEVAELTPVETENPGAWAGAVGEGRRSWQGSSSAVAV